MSRKRRYKTKVSIKEKIFMISNTLMIVVILSFYLFRLFFYKDYFESLQTSVDKDLLITIIQNRYKSMDSKEIDFDEESGIYMFHSDAVENYLSYSGRIFRILQIDRDGNIMAVSDSSESIFVLQDSRMFNENEINLWLNGSQEEEHTGIYFNSLDNPENNIIKGGSYSIVNNSDEIGRNVRSIDEYCTLLTLEDYQKFGGPASFMNTGESFWLASCDDNGNYWLVNSDGSVSLSKNKAQYAGIKAVICFNSQTMAIDGNGKAESPYLITDYSISDADELLTGTYVSYSSYLFRVLGSDENGVRLILDDVLKDENGQDYIGIYGTGYTYTVKSGIGKYLNSTFLNTLEKYDSYLVKNDFYYGEFSPLGTYSYLQGYQNSVNCYVGLPVLGELLLDGEKNIFLTNQTVSSERVIYSISDRGIIYEDLLQNGKAVRPIITLNPNIKISSGDGSIDNPYVLQEAGNE